MCGLRTRPRTDVDPPRFLDRTAIGVRGISSRRPRPRVDTYLQIAGSQRFHQTVTNDRRCGMTKQARCVYRNTPATRRVERPTAPVPPCRGDAAKCGGAAAGDNITSRQKIQPAESTNRSNRRFSATTTASDAPPRRSGVNFADASTPTSISGSHVCSECWSVRWLATSSSTRRHFHPRSRPGLARDGDDDDDD